ncbi:MAG: DUF3467 domain-containing protein [Chloroflexota bacterium]|nr:MAG: DUF3467 domain-containing protein [Chloroflexota bacterium]UCF28706.1 MAG: DUF3467 domain-containing protein [Chloroflexota bacterium]
MPDKADKSPPQRFPPMSVPDDIEAIYVNLVRIAHSPSEMVFDFAHLLPGTRPAKVRTRIVMSPLGAKLLQRALSENLARYEKSFGDISVPGSKSLADYLFRPTPPSDEPEQE